MFHGAAGRAARLPAATHMLLQMQAESSGLATCGANAGPCAATSALPLTQHRRQCALLPAAVESATDLRQRDTLPHVRVRHRMQQLTGAGQPDVGQQGAHAGVDLFQVAKPGIAPRIHAGLLR